MTKYAYLIERTDDDTEPERRTMSSGTRTLDEGWSTRALAEELLRDSRAAHSYYSGPLRCSLWPHDAGQPLPRTAPDHAEPYEVG